MTTIVPTETETPQLDLEQSLSFIRTVYGSAETGWIHLWRLEGNEKQTYWIDLAKGDAVHLYFQQHPRSNWYISTAIGPADKGPHQRLLASEAIGITGITVDLDIASPAHAKENLPPTVEDALALLEEASEGALPPSIVIHSGHGLQAWWLFREPWYFDSDAERQRAVALIRDWQATIRFAAARHGWTVDATHDLARVLRLPGTLNSKTTKDGTPLPAVPARILSGNASYGTQQPQGGVSLDDMPRYNPSDFDDHLSLDLGSLSHGEAPVLYFADLTLDPHADPPHAKHAALLINSQRYRSTWERKRQFPSGDQSASTYDLALANLLAKAGFSDQEIVDTCIAWRRHHGEDNQKKIARYDYWTRHVLGRVRTPATAVPTGDKGAASASVGVSGATAEDSSGGVAATAADAPGEVATRAQQAARQSQASVESLHTQAQERWKTAFATATDEELRRIRDEDVAQYLTALGRSYGVKIERIERLLTDEPQYFMQLAARKNMQVCTATELMAASGQTKLLAAIAKAVERGLSSFKKETWELVRQTFMLAAQDVVPGGESTAVERVASWLTQYLSSHPTVERAEVVKSGKHIPYFDKQGRTVIFSVEFAGHVVNTLEPGVKRDDVFKYLTAYGAIRGKENIALKSGGRTKVNIWTLPQSPVEGGGEDGD